MGDEKSETEIRPYNTPLKEYFDKHQNFYFSKEMVDYLNIELNVKTIGEFVSNYRYPLRTKLIENFPSLKEEEMLKQLDDFVFDAIYEVCDIQDLVVGLLCD